jgi:hypothetical protein
LFQWAAGDEEIDIIGDISADTVNAVAAAVTLVGDGIEPEISQAFCRCGRAVDIHRQNGSVEAPHRGAGEDSSVQRSFVRRRASLAERFDDANFISSEGAASGADQAGYGFGRAGRHLGGVSKDFDHYSIPNKTSQGAISDGRPYRDSYPLLDA